MSAPGRRPSRRRGCERSSAAEPAAGERLGVRRARLVRRSDDQMAELEGALRVLYRDYLAAGGLDSLRASRCRGRSRTAGKRGSPR